MPDDPDVQQARALLVALESHIGMLSASIEKAQRRRGAGPPTSDEKTMRKDLSEAYRHVSQIHARFPEARLSRAAPTTHHH